MVSEKTPAGNKVSGVTNVRLEMTSKRLELYVKPLSESIEEASGDRNNWSGSCGALMYLQGTIKVSIPVFDNQRGVEVLVFFSGEIARAILEKIDHIFIKGVTFCISVSWGQDLVGLFVQ
jgi:hypothetical protein